jgi:hypothetical protein
MKATDFAIRPKTGIPGNVSLSQSDRTEQTARGENRTDSQSSGYRSSIINNYALGGSDLSASTAATASAIPVWGWVAGGIAVFAWIYYRYGR